MSVSVIFIVGRTHALCVLPVVALPAGTPHILFNADNSSDVLYSISHSPAGPLGEAFFEGLAGLGWDYASIDRIHPLQVSSAAEERSYCWHCSVR
jgi:hypothetical protein